MGARLSNARPMRPTKPGDPYWTKVVALLHLDGNATDLTGKSWAITGSPAYNATSKFGGQSLFFNASGYLEGPTSSDWAFGTGDFTAECWAHSTGWPTGAWYCPLGNSGVSSDGWEFQLATDGTLHWAVPGREANISSSAGAFTINTWHHIAFSRNGSTRRLFLDGALVASGSTSDNDTSTSAVRVGANRTGTDFFKGYVDEVRITKGFGRYTAAFPVPVAAFYSGLPA